MAFLDYRNIADKYLWTVHARIKMRHYRLTESRVKRVMRHPARIEEGILENAVACMQPAEGKNYSEIWVMYVLARGDAISRHDSPGPAPGSLRKSEISAFGGPSKSRFSLSRKRIAARNDGEGAGRIKIITAWRYPGKSPSRDPVPAEILKEIRRIL
ncbi:MAG: hypothetical protein A2131_00835 [Candidatus Sungbacteria bacterium GWC2_49_10]|uniref:Uncharacterized protein n=1 Tax=Candidatus Sungbacteria bacterium GWC2_49_10 TaxID=1802263 RepID=A0A1G2K555_9BACT|nr:MAG: hypothetical protein A2131_00835 [Candidatus Sungbacteria bacterium GWC2_49_10]